MSQDPLWYKDAIIYQLHVRAFHDSDGDGIGDFRGLTAKLDYLQDLGVNTLWLLPFYPSPLKDDGYDIADYTSIHPSYGTLQDFKAFLKGAHSRGLRVITELVVNHTSDQHPWFQRARNAGPKSRWRDFYVWSDTPDRYSEARIIFKDFESSNWSWDPAAEAYYWHRFYSHQPDLNYENPRVRKAIIQVLDFWLDMGVDGLRLDAVPYLYEREGTNCENLPETHGFLKALRRHVDERYGDRMLLAEANQWPEDAVTYFGDGDECHMAFHFPVMPRLFMGVHMEDRFPIVDILEQTPSIPDSSQWAIFLRNHDELTLEMVTDEDRDYMYRVYAQDPRARINLGIRRRLAPLLGNNRRKTELMNSLLLSLPGTPVIYYGDELGMGDNIYLGDRNGVRTPMQWSADRNAGFSRANPQSLYLPVIIDPEYHFETVNVEAQQRNQHSLLWWMKRLINLRRRFRAFSRGSIEFLAPENRKVLVFLRSWEEERLLVVVNLSRFTQCVELELSDYEGMVPVEIFGRTRFPAIGELPYFLTLAPHTFYWFSLERDPARRESLTLIEAGVPTVEVDDSWEEVFAGSAAARLEEIFPLHLRARRWFGGKAKRILATEIVEVLPLTKAEELSAVLLLVEVRYSEGPPDIYQLPVAFVRGDRADRIVEADPASAVARLRVNGKRSVDEGLLYDAAGEREVGAALLDTIARRRRLSGRDGHLQALRARGFKQQMGEVSPEQLEPSVLRAEQSNTSIAYGDELILKIFRRVDEGVNPDLEIGRFLTERTSFTNLPPVRGALEYRPEAGTVRTLAELQSYVPNEGDAWKYTLDALRDSFEHALTLPDDERQLELPEAHPLELAQLELSAAAAETIGHYLDAARTLGRRTAEMHLALGSRTDDPDFAPEPMTAMYRRSLYQSVRTRIDLVLRLLRSRVRNLPQDERARAREVLNRRDELMQRSRAIVDRKVAGKRIRCHGDYHLGQLLYTGKDFVVMDFEGEPARPISERRMKRSPMKDVAGMLRSFHYASTAALITGNYRPEDVQTLEPWARFWYTWVAATFLKHYLEAVAADPLLPSSVEQMRILLDLHVIDKALYELEYELNNRPDWVAIPVLGILQTLGAGTDE